MSSRKQMMSIKTGILFMVVMMAFCFAGNTQNTKNNPYEISNTIPFLKLKNSDTKQEISGEHSESKANESTDVEKIDKKRMKKERKEKKKAEAEEKQMKKTAEKSEKYKNQMQKKERKEKLKVYKN